MTIEKQDYLYEVLIRFGPQGMSGAHQRRMTRLLDGGSVLSEQEQMAEPLSAEALADLIGAEAASLVAANAALQVRVEELEAALSNAPQTSGSGEGLAPLAPWRFRAMLEIAGLTQQVDVAIAGIEDAATRAVARAKLDYALEFRRDDPLIAMLAPVVGLTDEQIDQMWEQALALGAA